MVVTQVEKAGGRKGYYMTFYDPSGTLADPKYPLNVWAY
jgi:hypothetical protein